MFLIKPRVPTFSRRMIQDLIRAQGLGVNIRQGGHAARVNTDITWLYHESYGLQQPMRKHTFLVVFQGLSGDFFVEIEIRVGGLTVPVFDLEHSQSHQPTFVRPS